jgi:ATP-dependent DNA helicase RecG
VRSHVVFPDQRAKMWQRIRAHVDRGRQAYVVCPLIGESEALQVASAVTTYEEVSQGELAGYRVLLLHGRLAPAEKQAAMAAFAAGEADVLVSTTVVEVGVDVANATIMVIESARRFGLSQLHQLRGRVGRGSDESHCMLMADRDDDEALDRLALFARTTDGFLLAEHDLRARGEGQLFGERQSGFGDLHVARLLQDQALLLSARATARALLQTDPELKDPRHVFLASAAEERFGGRTQWLDRA